MGRPARLDSIPTLVAAGSLLIVAVGLVTFLSLLAPSAGANPPNRPNVLIIVTDDQRTGTIGFRATPTSPRWMEATSQRFFDQGTKFESAFAATPLCCPSRASIFTGRYPHNHGVTTNNPCNVMPPSTPRPAGCPDDGSYGRDFASFHNSTIQHYLRGAGYVTGLIGKYLNKWPLLDPPPDFDRWAYWQNGPHSAISQCAAPAAANDDLGVRCIRHQNIITRAPDGEYETDYAAARAREFLDLVETVPGEDGPVYSPDADNRSWFLYVAPTVPHAPYAPETPPYGGITVPDLNFVNNGNVFKPDFLPAANPDPDKDRRDNPPYNKPAWVTDTNPATRSPWSARFENKDAFRDEIMSDTGIRRQQLRMLKSVDDMVASIFAKLEEKGENNDTLAFFISDNGFMWGEHWLKEKAVAYTNAIRVPLMVRWPGRFVPGLTDNRLSANIDLAPTVLDATDIQESPATPMDGWSLLDPSQRTRILLERTQKNVSTYPPVWASLRTATDQYIESYTTNDAATGSLLSTEYYDDFWQMENKPTAPGAALPAMQLPNDRRCRGHGPAGQEPPPCP